MTLFILSQLSSVQKNKKLVGLTRKPPLCLVRGHMMPTKTSAGPKEVVRLEVFRLKLPFAASCQSLSLLAIAPFGFWFWF
jgi:hypothetical protein